MPAAHFPLLREASRDGDCRFTETVNVAVRLAHQETVVAVEGSAETVAGMVCGRCLNQFDAPVQPSFSLLFSPGPAPGPEAPNETIDLDQRDLGLYPYDGDEIDLTDAVQEQILLSLPMQPLCRKDCRGICPTCGADRNRQPCSCRNAPEGGPFAALRRWKPNVQP
jgi:uncharacterized protein